MTAGITGTYYLIHSGVTHMENNQQVAGKTVGQAKEAWLEVMFYLSVIFGLMHFTAILAQVVLMVAHTTFGKELSFQLSSSMTMGHLYLTFLAAYVGPKEFVRWLKRSDEDILSQAETTKITRGLYIVVGWALFTGIVVLFRDMGVINAVPEALLYTTGEVVALLIGTEVSKYLRNRQAIGARQDTSTMANYADKVLDYCRQKGSISRLECQNEFGLSEDQSLRLLQRMVKGTALVEFGEARNRRYKLP